MTFGQPTLATKTYFMMLNSYRSASARHKQIQDGLHAGKRALAQARHIRVTKGDDSAYWDQMNWFAYLRIHIVADHALQRLRGDSNDTTTTSPVRHDPLPRAS